MRLELTIPALPRLPNTLLGAHWRTRAGHAKKWKRLVGDALYEAYEGRGCDMSIPLKKARITFTRCSPRQCDADNLCSSFKAVLDALVHHSIIEDDSPQHVVCEYRHERVPKVKQGVRICMEDGE